MPIISHIGARLTMATAMPRAITGSVRFIKQDALVQRTDRTKFSGVLNAALVEAIARQLIVKHRGFSGEINLVQVCQSTGQNPANRQFPVWAIEILPGGEIDGTAFFAAGHHGPEYAGSHANLHLLDLVLTDLAEPTSNFKTALDRKALVFLPLVNPDGAILGKDGFAPLPHFGPKVDQAGFLCDSNIYHIYGGQEKIRPEATAIKAYLGGFIERFGSPTIAFDFHESRLIAGKDEQRQNRYLYAPIEMAQLKENGRTDGGDPTGVFLDMQIIRPAINQAIALYGDVIAPLITRGKPKNNFIRKNQPFLGFNELVKIWGARSFLIETPNVEDKLHVGDRVVLAMLAVETMLDSYVRDMLTTQGRLPRTG